MAKILVVDDEIANQDILKRFLIQAGHTILVASNGWEGYRMAILEKPDLIITDLRMPLMRGDTMALALDNEDFRVPFILMTADDPSEASRHSIWTTVLRKPFDLEEVLNTISRILKHLGIEYSLL